MFLKDEKKRYSHGGNNGIAAPISFSKDIIQPHVMICERQPNQSFARASCFVFEKPKKEKHWRDSPVWDGDVTANKHDFCHELRPEHCLIFPDKC